MAIKKDIASDYGFPISYWKATAITIDYLNMKAQSTALWYATKEAMDAWKINNHLDLDIVTVDLFWNQESLEHDKPVKSEALVTLEAKQDKTEQEQEEYTKLLNEYNSNLEQWQAATKTRQVVNDELKQAFETILKYQHLYHLKQPKLSGWEILPDNTEQYANKIVNE